MNTTRTLFPRTAFAGLALVAFAIASSRAALATEAAAPDLARLYENVVSSIVVVTNGVETFDSFGSGVVVHPSGYIVSAAHVVERADRIGVRFKNGETMEAEIVTLSEHQDLVLLKVPEIPAGMRIARLGNSAAVRPGQPVFCIGAPRGLEFSISAGIVSAVRKDVGNRYRLHSPDELIQTDAAVNPGNSGGALFNMQGEVVGIAVKTVTGGSGADSAGLGLAVPSNIVQSRLFKNALPYLGLHLQRIPPQLAEAMNWPPLEALLVEGVRSGSNAGKAGLHGGRYNGRIAGLDLLLGGDLIYEIGGIPVGEIELVHAYLHSLHPGEKVKYTILRAGSIQKFDVELEQAAPIPQLDNAPLADGPVRAPVPAIAGFAISR